MTRMYDSVNPSLIPPDAPIVAGYVDGLFGPGGTPPEAWTPAAWSRFSGSKVRITVFGSLDADVADVETGDLTPAGAAAWLQAGPRTVRPTIYCNRATLPAVQQACRGLTYDLWLATLDGTVPPGYAAVQYADTGAYDLSETAPWWPRGADMPRVVTGDQSHIDPRGDGATYLLMEPWKLYIPTPAALTDMNAAYGATQVIPQSRLDRFIDLGSTGAGVYQQFDPDLVANLLTTIKAELDQIHASSGGALDLSTITGPLAALSKHLGVGTA